MALAHLSKTVRQRFGAATRTLFILLTLTQFHVPFYASRTLPNFMAFPVGTFEELADHMI